MVFFRSFPFFVWEISVFVRLLSEEPPADRRREEKTGVGGGGKKRKGLNDIKAFFSYFRCCGERRGDMFVRGDERGDGQII